MKTEQDYLALLNEISSEFHDFKIKDKSESNLMKAIDLFLKIITFGQMKLFMTRFITTLGTTVYVPSDWADHTPVSKIVTLRHERIHMRQAKKYGRFLFSALYLLVPVPCLFAYFRRKFEQEAYEESMLAIKEYYSVDSLMNSSVKEGMIAHFTSAEYFWIWINKKDIEKWYDDHVESLRKN